MESLSGERMKESAMLPVDMRSVHEPLLGAGDGG
jgi:hypothetical protein